MTLKWMFKFLSDLRLYDWTVGTVAHSVFSPADWILPASDLASSVTTHYQGKFREPVSRPLLESD